MLPIVESTCSIPSAPVRDDSGKRLGDQRHSQPEHAADAQAGKKRQSAKSQYVWLKNVRPVKTE